MQRTAIVIALTVLSGIAAAQQSVIDPNAVASRALEQLGQQNVSRALDTANALLKKNPDDVFGLLIHMEFCFTADQVADYEGLVRKCNNFAERGLAVAEAASRTQKNSAEIYALKYLSHFWIGNQAILQEDYPDAQKHLRTAVELWANDYRSVYPLALAYLNSPRRDCGNGMWFMARAANLVPMPAYRKQIADFGQDRYLQLTGTTVGWEQLLKDTKTADLPPPSFHIHCKY